jgi:hypothetical protein
MRRLLLVTVCLIVWSSGCEKKASTEDTGPVQPRRMMKAGGGAVTGATPPAPARQ